MPVAQHSEDNRFMYLQVSALYGSVTRCVRNCLETHYPVISLMRMELIKIRGEKDNTLIDPGIAYHLPLSIPVLSTCIPFTTHDFCSLPDSRLGTLFPTHLPLSHSLHFSLFIPPTRHSPLAIPVHFQLLPPFPQPTRH